MKQERYINPYTDFGFKKLFEQAEIAKYSDAERRQYEESRKDYWDYYSTVTTAEKKGRAEGRAEGLAEGEQKGLAKGRILEKQAVARNLKGMGLGVADIVKATGLSTEEIEKL